MSEIKLCWNRSEVAPELAAMLDALAADYPIADNGDGIKIDFVKVPDAGVSRVVRGADGALRIEYGCLSSAARGVGTALSGLESNEKMTFTSYGIMLDASRNGVMTVEHFKKWLRQLALLGYNMAMLYTEDTYKLPGEPYFGYMRGAYTFEELREIDDYAAVLGIEMIGCIQTLGHMEQILKWCMPYNDETDTARVLNVGEEKTYALIGKIIDFWSRAFRSRRIHIGMDETHDLGRGKFMDKHGYVNGFELFNRHLARVNAICAEHGLSPMIWSDMYFRLGNDRQEYYDLNTNIPQPVRDAIPENVQLVYWDYYHDDYNFYRDFIKLHQELNRPLALGSGVWTWSKLWYDHTITKATIVPGLKACRDTGVTDVFFTMWGDDGAFCVWDSALAGLAYAADVSYGCPEDDARTGARFAAISHGDYAAHLLAGKLDVHGDKFPDWEAIPAFRLFWDDPVCGIAWNCHKIMDKNFDERVISSYAAIIDGLKDKLDGDGCADLRHPYLIARAITEKLKFRRAMLAAYADKNKPALAALAADIPAIVKLYEQIAESFRDVWNSTFKPFGFEVLQIRNAGQIERWRELERKLLDYSTGKLASIAELDEKLDSDVAGLAPWTKGVMTAMWTL